MNWGLPRGTRRNPSDLPALGRSSDIAWGFWNRYCDLDVASIPYFVIMIVVNTET